MQYLFVVKDIVVIYKKKKLFDFNPFETLFFASWKIHFIWLAEGGTKVYLNTYEKKGLFFCKGKWLP